MSSRGWQLDRSAAEEALNILRSANNVCFPTHQNVDADGISSALAMLEGLRRNGGNGFVVISDGKIELPSAPGLGIELNREALDAYKAEAERVFSQAVSA